MYKTINIKIILMLIVGIIVGYSNNLYCQYNPPIADEPISLIDKILKDGFDKFDPEIFDIEDDYHFTTTIITHPDAYPELGAWNGQKAFSDKLIIEDCEYHYTVEWSCRYAINGDHEIIIHRLTIEGKSKECQDKLEQYKAQIIDRIAFILYEKATCFSNIDKAIKACNGEKPSTFFRLFVSTCGTWKYKIDKHGIHKGLFPCSTKTYCRLKYSYCYIFKNGKKEVVEYVEKEYGTDIYPYYGCPPYEEYIDEEGKQSTRVCRDPNCEQRATGYYIIDLNGRMTKPDINFNPPDKLEDIPCVKE